MRSEQEIIIIAAMAENRVIGKDNKMPWNIRGNLVHFKEMTMGYPCIMGRKTWESLPKKPLQGRLNIVISKTMKNIPSWPDNIITDCTYILEAINKKQPEREIKICASIQDAVESCKEYEKIFIIGGESIYKQSMALANKIDLTLIPGEYDGDTFFPEIDDSWIKTGTVNYNDFNVITYIRRK